MSATHDVPTKIPRTSNPRVGAHNQYSKRQGREVLSERRVTHLREGVPNVPVRNRPPHDDRELTSMVHARISLTPSDLTTESDSPAPRPISDRVIRIVVVEANRLVGEALTALLNRAPDIRAIIEPQNGREEALPTISPDVVLLNLGHENGNSLRVTRDVQDNFPKAKVIVTNLPAREEFSAFLNAGVYGFIMMDANLEVALNTVRAVSAGLKVLPDGMTSTVRSEVAKEAVLPSGLRRDVSLGITPREQEVILLIADGLSNKAIGKRLHISCHTVKSHLRNIMRKLGANSRLEIATYFHRRRAGVADDGGEA